MYEPNYQREVDIGRVDKIKARFDEAKLDPPLLNRRITNEGEFSIVDGLQRTTTMRELGYEYTKCAVIEVPLLEEGELFLHQYDHTRKINPRQQFNARVVLGDPDYIKAQQICSSQGFFIPSRHDTETPARSIRIDTTTGVTYTYNLDTTGDVLDQALQIVYKCWYGAKKAQHHDLLRGVGHMVQEYSSFLTEDALDEWSLLSPTTAIEPAAKAGSQSDRAKAVAEGLRKHAGIRKKRNVAF